MAATRRHRRQRNQQRTGALLGVAGALIAALLSIRCSSAVATTRSSVASGGPTVSDGDQRDDHHDRTARADCPTAASTS